MRVDFQKEGEGGFTLYPEGTYHVRIESIERTMATTGNEQVKWLARITGGQFSGGKVTEFTPLTERGIWRTVKMIKSCIGMKSFGSLKVIDTNEALFDMVLKSCVGKELQWLIGHKEYNGKQQIDIIDFLPLPQENLDEEVMSLNDLPDFLKDRMPGQEG